MRRRYQLFAWVLLPVVVGAGLFFWPLTAVQCQMQSVLAGTTGPCAENVISELQPWRGSSWWWLPVETTLKRQLQQQGFRLLSWHKVLPGTLVIEIAEPELLYRIQPATQVMAVSQQGALFPVPDQHQAQSLPLVVWSQASEAATVLPESSRQVPDVWHMFLNTVVSTALASKQPLRQIRIQSAEVAELVFGDAPDQLHVLIDRAEPAVQVQRASMLYQQREQLNLPEPRPVIDARYRLPIWRSAAPAVKPTASAAAQVASSSSGVNQTTLE